MSRNPDKKKCAHPGCRAWAKRGETVCSSHCKPSRVGAPRGNVNAVRHGLYGAGSPGDIGPVPTLNDEIRFLASRRDAVDQWIVERLAAGAEVDVLRYLALIGEIGSRIARMLKIRSVLGESSDVLEQIFEEALDLLNERVAVEV